MQTPSSFSASDGLWLHAFGIVDGLFLSAVFYMLFFSLTTLKHARGRFIGVTFFLLALSITFFSFYSLYFQAHNQTINSLMYPSWLISTSKFCAPLALVLISELFLRNITIESYADFKLVKLLNAMRYISVAVSLVAIIILAFIDASSWALVIIQIMFTINLIVGVYINHDNSKHTKRSKASLDKIYKNKALNTLFMVSMVICILYSIYLLFTDGLLPQTVSFVMVFSYGIIALLVTFGMVRYGFDEVKRHHDIRQTDYKNLTSDLYTAIEQGQFFLVFQPKVSLKSQRVSGFESLVRWQHPIHGVISPKVFIPLTEKMNVTSYICEFVIEETIKQTRDLMNHGYKLPMSMNLSASDIHPQTIDHISICMERYRVPAHLLMVEVSESLLVELSTEKLTALHMLHSLSIPISLDDYGTGFSSLSYIRSLGIKQLKVDKSFIKDLNNHPDNQVIVRSTLQMSKGLKIKAVAEGVETEPTKRLLNLLGYDEIQGYIISPPLNKTQLYQWLHANEKEDRHPAITN